MRKHSTNPQHKRLSKDNELQQVYTYLQKNCATATMTATALNIYRPNLCRYKMKLQKAGQLAEVKKGYCKITKHLANFLTTNPDLFPITSQLNLF
ncbi:hypothetical protein LK994_05210 [Ferruginibacter lapsinanis]|uniref:hypothetical protein n=1 Tax=Ferruginibacter lapsinanis TaxID=563172 RepID=UPI001E397E56|nr:hypothetical protein [Ferruginibacter lapsinanis]UEG50872.1 hypothetical protein LK994_05210 [Ferruginibacter lapsinanis]